MRKRKAYVILDQIAETYSEWIFPAMNENDAKRAFQAFLSKEQARPQDVVLFEIGEYDRIDGKIKGYDIPLIVASGIDVMRKEAPNGE